MELTKLMSDQVDQLATALAKAQAEFATAGKSKSNPFFKSKYADLESIIDASRPSLTKYGLSVSQSPFFVQQGESSCLITILLHASGQWIKSIAPYNPPKNDIQSLSSYNTYLRRMCYASLVGVVTGEEDDDGERAVNFTRNQQTQTSSIDRDQIAEINRVLHGYPIIRQDALRWQSLEDVEDLPREKFIVFLNAVNQKIALAKEAKVQ